jgi:hypothetical protein
MVDCKPFDAVILQHLAGYARWVHLLATAHPDWQADDLSLARLHAAGA